MLIYLNIAIFSYGITTLLFAKSRVVATMLATTSIFVGGLNSMGQLGLNTRLEIICLILVLTIFVRALSNIDRVEHDSYSA